MSDNMQNEIVRLLDNKIVLAIISLAITIILIILTGVEDINSNGFKYHETAEIKTTLRVVALLSLIISVVLVFSEIRKYNSPKRKNKRVIDDLSDKTNFDGIPDILLKYVTKTELDYLGYCKSHSIIDYPNPKMQLRMDEKGIDKHFTDQVSEYKDIASSMFEVIDTLNDKFKDLEQGVLVRIVFDVEEGGIFYYHINDNPKEYLFGATVDQEKMDDHSADSIMKDVRKKIKKYS